MTINEKITRAIKEHKSCIMSNNNTYVTWDGNKVTCKLWNTDVFTADFDQKAITVSNGGWNTPTTADRISTCFRSLGIPCDYSYAKDGRLRVFKGDHCVSYDRRYFEHGNKVNVDGDSWLIEWV